MQVACASTPRPTSDPRGSRIISRGSQAKAAIAWSSEPTSFRCLREAILRVLVERLGAERLPDSCSGYQQRVRLDGRGLHVTVAERPSYVNVSMDGADGDPAMMARVAKRLDAIIATGELDDLFVEPARSRQ